MKLTIPYEMKTYKSGAKRSGRQLRFDLIVKDMPDALRGIARRSTEGAVKYGDHNWKKGGEDFEVDLFNHGFEHDLKFYSNNLDDEVHIITHKEAKLWNAMADVQSEWDKLRATHQPEAVKAIEAALNKKAWREG